MQITPNIYQVDDTVGGVFLIVDDAYLSLVDSGVPQSDDKILAQIIALGRKPTDLKHILVTHSDGDHIGALPALVAASHAQVYAQADEAAVVTGQHKSRGGQMVMVAQAVPVSRIIKEGDVLPLHGGIRVVESFGHTTGHVCFHLLAQNLLFAGDCINNTQGLKGANPQYTLNMEQANATVKQLATLGVDSICFGHGPAIIGGAAAQLRQLAEAL